MKRKSKQPVIPVEQRETIRQKIVSVLEGRNMSAKEISGEVSISEKEVYLHLEHIQRSFIKKQHDFIVMPAECKRCGFTFKKRERLKKPGKCPVCRSESIQDPLFSIKGS